MTWVLWRQYRLPVAIAGALLAAFAIMALITGLQMAARWHTALADHATSGLALGTGPVATLIFLMVILGPLVLGMFWGAPSVSRELESGTIQFAWVQSMTRRRWLASRTGWLLLASAVFGGAIGGIATWWYSPVNALKQGQFGQGFFDIQGIVPIGYAVFAVALGICAGTLIGRSLPALAVTGGVSLGLRLAFTYWIRAHYLAAVTTVYSVTQSFTPKGAAWQLGTGTVLPGGQLTTSLVLNPQTIRQSAGGPDLPAACQVLTGQISSTLTCMAHAGYKSFATYQPGYRFWPFQFIETGIFVALAAALIAVTFFVVRRGDA
jgi:ABC-type transport system involved in multi-copper enzyme maturation permease subunit